MATTPGGPRALLLHGLGGSGGTWWAVAEALSAAGWSVTAPDLRGHGAGARSRAARGFRHDDYAADALATRPEGGGAWDLVLGHSLGGAVAVRAAATDSGWADRLALLDPVLLLAPEQRAEVRAGELADLGITEERLEAEVPHWQPRDRAEKARAAGDADPVAVAATLDENDPWDVCADAGRLRVPVLILGGDPAVFTLLPPRVVAEVLRSNPRVRYAVVAGAGHSPHRDRPEATLAMLREWAESAATA